MGRPKGSKNKKPAAYLQPKLKSQFANSDMANKLHAEFCAGRGVYAYDALREKYEKIFDQDYFCLTDFDTAWKKLLKKVQALHGIDYLTRYNEWRTAITKPRTRN